MKKLIYCLILFFAGLSTYAQPHLRISSIAGIPVDSVFETNTYNNIYVNVVNEDSASFTDSVYILIKSSSIQFTDTLVHDTLVSIQSGDSVTLSRSNYIFSTQYYSEGDNIIVVWPMTRQVPIITDSLTFNIYYVSLLASVLDLSNESITLYPNPSTKYISFKGADELKVKYVRIYDDTGKLIYSNPTIQQLIPTMDWKPGLYFINIEKADGTFQFYKIQKN